MNHDEIKLKVIDIDDGVALIEAAKPPGKPLTQEQKQALIQAEKKKEEEKRNLGVLHFNKEEWKQMPKKTKRAFRLHGIFGRPRITEDGLYQIRTRAQGLNIQVTHKDFSTCKRLYVEALENALNGVETTKKSEPLYFTDYMQTWLETVKKASVKEITYKDYIGVFNANIKPIFSQRKVKDISRQEIQDLINSYAETEKNRTAKKIYQLLKPVFDCAVSDGLLVRSPMERVVLPKYEQTHGKDLSRKEEKTFKERVKGTPYEGALLFMLYTGTRRSELANAVIDGSWVRIISAKQRKGAAVKARSIPITPMLAEVLPKINLSEIKTTDPALFTKWVKKIMPNHHCHDLRHTFITRCQECGVPTPIVSLWAGHSIAGIDSSLTVQVYSHYSEETQLKEAAKVKY